MTLTEQAATTADGIPTLEVPLEQLTTIIEQARADGYDRFVDLTAVDLLSRQDRFQLVYLLYSMTQRAWLRIKTRTDAEAPSLVESLPAITWYERELFDLFGIRFEGHPDLQRILLPDDWQGYPLRRTEPLGSEPVDFTVTRGVYGRD